VESAPGRGTAVRVYWPHAAEPVAVRAEPNWAAP
jgi:hypothetical protein